jgi:hypothetical protein
MDVKEYHIPSRLLPDWYIEKVEAYNRKRVRTSVSADSDAKKVGKRDEVAGQSK